MERNEEDLKKAIAVRKVLEVLKKEYGLKIEDVLEAFEGSPLIPAEIFNSERTPLETVVLFLRDERKKTLKETSVLLNRSTSIVNNALRNGAQKAGAKEFSASNNLVPIAVFADKKLTPAEALIAYLREHYALPNAHIAKILGRDARNTWRIYSVAQRKRAGAGGEQ